MKFLVITACVLIGVFFVFKVVNIISDEYDTVSAEESSVYDTVDVKGYLIRDESLLINSSGGTVVAVASNAEKVNSGSTVALSFASESAANSYVELNYLKDMLDGYRRIDNQTAFTSVDVSQLGEEVNSDFRDIVSAVYCSDYSSLGDLKLEFLIDFSRRQISLGKNIDCESKISSLQSEISQLEGVAGITGTISAGSAGYYVSQSDGYEDVIPCAGIDTIKTENIQSALKYVPKSPPAGCVGKVVNGFYWYLAAVIDTDDANRFNQGDEVFVILGNTGTEKIKTTVYRLDKESEKKSLVILKSNNINADMLTSRIVNAKIILNEITGLKVPQRAVRMVDGMKSCYVRVGNVTKLRCLNVIYSCDEYVIASDDGSLTYPKTHLKKHDEIILNGRGLGKNG